MCKKIEKILETVDQFQQIDQEIEEEMAMPQDDFVIVNARVEDFYEPPFGVLRSLGSTLLKAFVIVFGIIICLFPEQIYTMIMATITLLVIVFRGHIIGKVYALLRYFSRI